MVAPTSKLPDRFAPPPEPLVAGRWRLLSLTRKDAEAMVRMGIIPEDASTEVLNGWIVLKDRSAVGQYPTRVGKDHTKCVERLSNLRIQMNGPERHVRSQQPLDCRDTHAPEPDFMVLRGNLDSYPDQPPASAAFCVIEVADSSYERDTGEKLRGYAEAGIAQYIVINLRNQTAEVYTQPDASTQSYPPPKIIHENEILELRVGYDELFSVTLGEILP